MNSSLLRQHFFEFFRSKGHHIVSSAPMVVKNDPTLMFTNAGMNQFKDFFLGNRRSDYQRIANSQKCLRVSGKHNDLEEVGHDTYHHTMFEMLGNWSFGDYFKKEAVQWAWEFLHKELGIPEDRLYATVFEGDTSDGIPRDDEASDEWKKCFTDHRNRILEGSKKDNFWEMGDTGPCGPCSEIHIDIRSDSERKSIPGHTLVNKGNPQVIEIWNLVFIQYNRKADGSLELLPDKHVDTGMGFERLCMVLQGKKSNYDTDIFQGIIAEIAAITGIPYGKNEKSDTAMRVIADHLRAIAFSIADGQLPSNNKAGYVIRRILRRAVRYGYNYLGAEEPFIWKLVPALITIMGDHYTELKNSGEQITRIIHEEEASFLRTLGKGLKMLGRVMEEKTREGISMLPGKVAFELYDTYGFPPDLTRLILKENQMDFDQQSFENEMKDQKNRSREDAAVETGDWIIVNEGSNTIFTGYKSTEEVSRILRYRLSRTKGKETWHIVLDKTPFYAESGGQSGDSGMLISGSNTLRINDTIKENELIIHLSPDKPVNAEDTFRAVVDKEKRDFTANNHTATHLIHYALREVLGKHVEQKGSLVNHEHLRFDFTHFAKLTADEIKRTEDLANKMVRANHQQKAIENIPIEEARAMGAMALFGEKYGERVRVIEFGDSVELCGGTHVSSTSSIGIIKIISEGAIAAGIRRIEAITGQAAFDYISNKLSLADEAITMLKGSGSIIEGIGRLQAENQALRKSIDKYRSKLIQFTLEKIISKQIEVNGIKIITGSVEDESPETLKAMAFEIKKTIADSVAVLGSSLEGKAYLAVMVSENLVAGRQLNAVSIIKEVSQEISGGGGGQPFLATAGGKNPGGIGKAISKAVDILKNT